MSPPNEARLTASGSSLVVPFEALEERARDRVSSRVDVDEPSAPSEVSAPASDPAPGASRIFVDPGDSTVARRSNTQDRLHEFMRLLGGTQFALGLLGLAMSAFEGVDVRAIRMASAIDVGFAVTLGLSAQILQRAPRSMRTLAIVDALTAICVSVLVVFMSMMSQGTLGTSTEVGGMVLTITLMLRVAVVPSSPRRTFVVGLLCGGASVAVLHVAPHPHAAIHATRDHFAFGVYALLMTLVTTKASKVIFGLHERVAAARRLGQYVLVDKIGEGGMGSVWRARHAMLRRPTAVKLMNGDRTSDRDIRRFEREVQLTSQLTHPNTVAVYDYGRADDGTLYYVMEYVDGLSLEQLVERYGKQSPARVIHLLRQIASALEEAHGLGLIHRDVKPPNVLVCVRGGAPDFVKVVDFGLVKAMAGAVRGRGDARVDGDAGRAPKNANANVTIGDGNLVAGTPEYLAPETITAPDTVDGRADLYAVGALAHYLLAGRPVFEGNNLVEICSHHIHTAPTPVSKLVDGVPPELEHLVLRLLAKNPADRPRDAGEVRERLDELAVADPWPIASARAFWRDHRDEG